MRKLLYYIYIVILSIILGVANLVTQYTPAVALSNPTSITIDTFQVFQNIYQTGDMVFIGQGEINYVAPPVTSVSTAFSLNLYDTTGNVLLFSRPMIDFASGNAGYDYTFNALYFSAAQVVANNITWNTPYQVRIQGNPAIFGATTEGVNQATVTLGAANYINFIDTVTNYENFNSYCLNGNGQGIAKSLQTHGWVTLITTGTNGAVLNSDGRNFFLQTLPGLDTVDPSLFQTTQSSMAVTFDTHNQSLASQYTINGTLGTTISQSFNGVGTMLGISGGEIFAIWGFFLMLMVAAIVFLYTGNSTIALIVATPMTLVCVYVGAFPMWIFFAGIFLIFAYAFYHIALR